MREAWGNMGIVHFQWWFFGACGRYVSRDLLDCSLCMCSCCIPIFSHLLQCFSCLFYQFLSPSPVRRSACSFCGCLCWFYSVDRHVVCSAFRLVFLRYIHVSRRRVLQFPFVPMGLRCSRILRMSICFHLRSI